nr:unnamed protein product [Callosobruchus analis]
MEELKDKNISQTTVKICEDLKKCSSYITLYDDIQKLVVAPNVRPDEFKGTLLKAMQDHGLDAELRNNVFRWLKNRKREVNKEPDPLGQTNTQVSEFYVQRTRYKLAKIRGTTEKEEILSKWTELSNFDVDIHKYRPVYAPKDFLEVLLNLKGPTRVRSQGFAAFEAERIAIGEKILLKHYAPLAQEYLKKGCPRCLRARIWTLLLGAEVKHHEKVYYESLKGHVLQYDMMIDKLIIKDINLTASNDDQYFVFEDVLYQVLLCFSRDSDILRRLPNQPAFMQVFVKGKQNTQEGSIVFPPSGVIPFHGFTMYAAPFCYLFENPIELYFVFRTFYLRYWHRLHRVCANSQGIVSLCLLFERLLQCFEPFCGIISRNTESTPYDSLEIIPLLAAAIVVFRKDNLMKVSTLQNMEAVLADLSSISVIPLIQMALMKE